MQVQIGPGLPAFAIVRLPDKAVAESRERVRGALNAIGPASTNRYTLTFRDGGLPPVNAFWSVTMYDGKTQLLIENPINRYLINAPMLPDLKKNGDGSITLYIQKNSPGADKEPNWLPAPDGPAYIVMRLYWPKEDSPSIYNGTWKPPAVQQTQ